MSIKNIILIFLVILISISLYSCAVVNSLLGYDECNYPDCSEQCARNCNYCITHCTSYIVPDDLEKKADKSINEQMKRYRSDQKHDWKKVK